MGGPDDASQHYFSAEPVAASKPTIVQLALPDLTVELASDRGVFSGDRVDPGTKLLLLEGAPPPAGPGTYLDLGCGYGPIAVTVALRAPEATVWAVDVNQRARDLCATNAARAGVAERVHVASPDDVPGDLAFDGIWSNPPIRIGKPALRAMMTDWLARLSPAGRAHLVVNKNLGADSLADWLRSQGFSVERTGSRMGYRLLTVTRPTEEHP